MTMPPRVEANVKRAFGLMLRAASGHNIDASDIIDAVMVLSSEMEKAEGTQDPVTFKGEVLSALTSWMTQREESSAYGTPIMAAPEITASGMNWIGHMMCGCAKQHVTKARAAMCEQYSLTAPFYVK